MTGASDLSRAVLDDACRSSRVDRGLPSPRGKAQPKPEGDDDGDAQPVPLLQDAPPGTDSAAATSSTRAGFESGFSRLLLLVEKHKRAAAASDASASDVDTVDGEENGSSVHAIPTKLAAAWATSPEAFGVGVVWDERLLKLFKPLCMCRVATANRTRGVRQRLHAVAQESGDDGVQTEKVLGKPVLVCAALGSPPPPTHYDKECTFVPTICPKSQKMAEVNRVRA